MNHSTRNRCLFQWVQQSRHKVLGYCLSQITVQSRENLGLNIPHAFSVETLNLKNVAQVLCLALWEQTCSCHEAFPSCDQCLGTNLDSGTCPAHYTKLWGLGALLWCLASFLNSHAQGTVIHSQYLWEIWHHLRSHQWHFNSFNTAVLRTNCRTGLFKLAVFLKIKAHYIWLAVFVC